MEDMDDDAMMSVMVEEEDRDCGTGFVCSRCGGVSVPTFLSNKNNGSTKPLQMFLVVRLFSYLQRAYAPGVCRRKEKQAANTCLEPERCHRR